MVVHFRSKRPKAIAEIHLASKLNAGADRPTHFTNEALSGHAVFKLSTDLDITHCKVTLRGRPQ